MPISLEFNLDGNRLQPSETETFLSTWLTDDFCLRLRSLKLVWFSREELTFTWPHLARLLGSLTHLTLMIEDDYWGDVVQLPPHICSLMQRSALLELRLEGCLPVWTNANICATLTRLELGGYCTPDDHLFPTSRQLATVLCSLRCLQYLRLRDVFPKDALEHEGDHVVLPALKMMIYIVTESLENGIAFLSHVTLSPSSCSHIYIADNGYDTLLRQGAMENTMLSLRRVGGGIVQPLELIVQRGQVLFGRVIRDRCAWSTSIPQNIAESDGYPEARTYRPGETNVALDDDYCNPSEKPMPNDYISGALLHGLHAIAFGHRALQSLTDKNLLAGLSAAHGVHRLGIDLLGSGPLSLALGATSHSGSHYLFPNLEIIHVHVGPVANRDVSHESEESLEYMCSTNAIMCSADAIELVALVRARKVRGVPLQEIALEKELANWAIWDTIRSEVEVTVL